MDSNIRLTTFERSSFNRYPAARCTPYISLMITMLSCVGNERDAFKAKQVKTGEVENTQQPAQNNTTQSGNTI